VNQVSLVPGSPPSQSACQPGTVGFTCDFTVQVDYSNAPVGATIDGSVTGTGSPPGAPAEVVTAPFSMPVNPSTNTASATVSLFFRQDPCVEASTADAATERPNAATSPVVAFGNVCAPPLTVRSVTLTPDDPSQTGCQPGAAGYVCSFTVVVDYVGARPGARITGSVSGTDAPPQVPPLVSTATFAVTADPSAGSASATVKLVCPSSPCVEDSTAVAATDQPNAVSSTPVRFGRVCTPG
jgi:hypothetical protein